MAWVLPWPRPRQASLMSACAGAMFPRPGPPRMMLTNTVGTSAPIRYDTPSSIRLKPGELVNVMQRMPAPPAPYIMLTVATSLTACTNTPPRLGCTLAISSAPSVDGVIG